MRCVFGSSSGVQDKAGASTGYLNCSQPCLHQQCQSVLLAGSLPVSFSLLLLRCLQGSSTAASAAVAAVPAGVSSLRRRARTPQAAAGPSSCCIWVCPVLQQAAVGVHKEAVPGVLPHACLQPAAAGAHSDNGAHLRQHVLQRPAASHHPPPSAAFKNVMGVLFSTSKLPGQHQPDERHAGVCS